MSLSSSMPSWETPGRLDVIKMRRRHGSTPDKRFDILETCDIFISVCMVNMLVLGTDSITCVRPAQTYGTHCDYCTSCWMPTPT